jgi:glycosyltransferase involved in cell wall biosynthesis
MAAPSDPEVSVVLSTYNRAALLPAALGALLDQTGGVAYEIIVVDNNSTDATRPTVEALAATAGGRLRYAFEPRQGLSYGRNTGIGLARAPIVAFTDDDVRVAPDWVASIREVFAHEPGIDYVGGRVLPRWAQPPPRWLTDAHWAPLALQDYGPDPFVTGRQRAICLVGASLAFRRRVFDRVGLFHPALQRVKDGIGSTEDHEFQLRVWRAGMRGLYAPEVVAVADIPPERMTRAYHRRWHRGHGRHCALMRLRELVPADLGPMTEPDDLVRLFGVPAFVYAELPRNAARWLEAVLRRRDPFFYANKLRHYWHYILTGARLHAAGARRRPAAEIGAFAVAYWRKRRARRRRAVSSAG